MIAALTSVGMVHAFAKRDLERAIRQLDVGAVERIVAHETFSRQEYTRYLDLAEEMVRHYDVRVLHGNYGTENVDFLQGNMTVLTGETASVKGELEVLAGVISFAIEMAWLPVVLDGSPIQKGLFFSALAASFLFTCKGAGDCYQQKQDFLKRLRAHYDDALTIKQLIYSVEIIS